MPDAATTAATTVLLTRRVVLTAGAGLGAALLVPPMAAAQDTAAPSPAELAAALAAAIAGFTGGAPVAAGKVRLEVPPLVDNGNAVPLSVAVESPMTAAEHVSAIAVFNERNPQREVAQFALGPRAGKAEVATRIRLATSQKLVAVAKLSDGSYWSHTVNVVVTLAACLEGEPGT